MERTKDLAIDMEEEAMYATKANLNTKQNTEIMYSEEEMIEYSDYCLMCSAEKTLKIPLLPKEWFEQHKKKTDGK